MLWIIYSQLQIISTLGLKTKKWGWGGFAVVNEQINLLQLKLNYVIHFRRLKKKKFKYDFYNYFCTHYKNHLILLNYCIAGSL